MKEFKKKKIYKFAFEYYSPVSIDDEGFDRLSDKEKESGIKKERLTVKRMFKEEPTNDELQVILVDIWNNYIKENQLSTQDSQNAILAVQFLYEETWVPGWFSHWTLIEEGMTDEDYLRSFREYVDRHAYYQDYEYDQRPPNAVALMGANEEWRWRSGSSDHEGIPCRCELCTGQGIVKIVH